MSLLQVSYNVNKINSAIEKLTALEKELREKGQRGWAGRLRTATSEIEAALGIIKGAAMRVEDDLASKLENQFTEHLLKLESAKELKAQEQEAADRASAIEHYPEKSETVVKKWDFLDRAVEIPD